jgi:electron transfer flavoprotein alpha subunit
MSQDIWVVVETLRGDVSENSYTMLAAGRALADGLGSKLIALLLGHKAETLANMLGTADEVRYVDHSSLSDFTPDAYQRVITGLIKEDAPRAVLFGHSTIGMDMVCGIGIELDAPLITYCQKLEIEEGTPRYISLTCGGKVLAGGELPERTSLVTIVPGGYKPEQGKQEGAPEVTQVSTPVDLDDLRVILKGYIEPDVGDVDVTKEAILVSVGRGIQQQDNLKLAEELASAMGGAVSASRPIVDQGWLPTSRLIGKSGMSVKPRLYLPLGISGAPEHMEGVADFETMIAINTDERAPIFDFAQYGATVDVLDLLPVLIEKVKEAKSG